MSEDPSGATGSESEPLVAPAFEIVAGWPTDEEIAALVAVLTAVSGAGAEPPPRSPSRWSAPGTRLRTTYGPARGAWRASGMPR